MKTIIHHLASIMNLAKVLACNRKVAGLSPARVRFFSPMSVHSSTLQK